MPTYRAWTECQGETPRLLETLQNIHRVEYLVHLMPCGRDCRHTHWAETVRGEVQKP